MAVVSAEDPAFSIGISIFVTPKYCFGEPVELCGQGRPVWCDGDVLLEL
jgi:hypothetical protein